MLWDNEKIYRIIHVDIFMCSELEGREAVED